ncbi:hypothetical protein AG1IA_01881 [Rhizoctonia solani AG-1 IA]|uniref:Uncharacterized protein n=1 Tax=Thanatephorus cucumeris (strain AG1-IA) TaxID=983506 RepID=L8X4Y5_THACA|nr:hypothetical protein AG1IA_01881 [Rhizoctonia solani AG-1 IA]
MMARVRFCQMRQPNSATQAPIFAFPLFSTPLFSALTHGLIFRADFGLPPSMLLLFLCIAVPTVRSLPCPYIRQDLLCLPAAQSPQSTVNDGCAPHLSALGTLAPRAFVVDTLTKHTVPPHKRRPPPAPRHRAPEHVTPADSYTLSNHVLVAHSRLLGEAIHPNVPRFWHLSANLAHSLILLPDLIPVTDRASFPDALHDTRYSRYRSQSAFQLFSDPVGGALPHTPSLSIAGIHIQDTHPSYYPNESARYARIRSRLGLLNRPMTRKSYDHAHSGWIRNPHAFTWFAPMTICIPRATFRVSVSPARISFLGG